VEAPELLQGDRGIRREAQPSLQKHDEFGFGLIECFPANRSRVLKRGGAAEPSEAFENERSNS
jgi:hypothetical protein